MGVAKATFIAIIENNGYKVPQLQQIFPPLTEKEGRPSLQQLPLPWPFFHHHHHHLNPPPPSLPSHYKTTCPTMSTEDSPHLHWRYTEFDDRSFEIRGRTFFFIIVLFSFILVVTLLFLYVRWVCRYHRHVPSSSSTVSAAATPPPSQGLDPAVISSLPIILHQLSSLEDGVSVDDCCSICLGIFQEGDKVKLLPECHHYYHPECVDRWLSTQTSCPLCRASVRFHSPS